MREKGNAVIYSSSRIHNQRKFLENSNQRSDAKENSRHKSTKFHLPISNRPGIDKLVPFPTSRGHIVDARLEELLSGIALVSKPGDSKKSS